MESWVSQSNHWWIVEIRAVRLSRQHISNIKTRETELPASQHNQDKSKIINMCCVDLEEGLLGDDAGSGKTESYFSQNNRQTNKKNNQGEFYRNMCTKYEKLFL